MLGGPPWVRPRPPHLRFPSSLEGRRAPRCAPQQDRRALCAGSGAARAASAQAPAPHPTPEARPRPPTFLRGRLRARPTSGRVGSSASTSWGGKSHCTPSLRLGQSAPPFPRRRSRCAPLLWGLAACVCKARRLLAGKHAAARSWNQVSGSERVARLAHVGFLPLLPACRGLRVSWGARVPPAPGRVMAGGDG